MKYTDIQGWFSEEWLYDRMVREASARAVFVEMGCWLGKSTLYLAQAIQQSGKQIVLFAVDTWEGSPDEPDLLAAVRESGGSIHPQFHANMMAGGVTEIVKELAIDSQTAAALFSEQTVDFIYIDGDHRAEAVRSDIQAWQPKIKKGGLLAGHDWNTYGSVQTAVRDCLGKHFKVEGNAWMWTRV